MKTGRKNVKMVLISTALVFFATAMWAGMAGAQGGYGMMGPGMMRGGMMQGGGMMGPGMMGPGMMRGGGMMGSGMMRGNMMGSGMMQGGMMGPAPQLSPEDRVKIAAANADFWKKTEDLRGDIYRKRLEMQIEMSKKSPDEVTLMKIQDELLALQGQVAKLRIKQRLALKAINPRLGMMGPGMLSGGMMGPGMMRGGMMGQGMGMMQGGGMMGQGMGRHHGMMGGCMKKRGMMGMGRGAGMMGGGMMPANPAGGAAQAPAPAAPTTPSAGSGTGSGTATQQ